MFVALRPTNEWQSLLELPPENLLYVSVRNSFGMVSARQISSFVKAARIDIIHAHSARDYLAATVVRRAVRGSRLVITRHTEQPLKPFHRLALRNVDAAIATSQGVYQQMAPVFPGEKLHLVPCVELIEIDEDVTELGAVFRQQHDIAPDAQLIASVGELAPSAGQRDLVLAAGELITKYPAAHFIIAGDDLSLGSSFRRELRRLAKVLGSEGRFTFLAMPTDTQPLLAAADILVAPSHHGGVPADMLRAMAMGLPVIISDGVDAAALMDDPRALIRPRDPVALAQAIETYLADEVVRREAGHEAAAAVRRRFSSEHSTDGTERVYQRICRGRK